MRENSVASTGSTTVEEKEKRRGGGSHQEGARHLALVEREKRGRKSREV